MNAPVRQTKPFRWWHEAIIDDMLANPFDSAKERGARLGYSPEYIRTIMSSDMFKAAYRARRDEFNERMDTSLTRKLHAVTSLSLDVMKESLEKKRTAIPFADIAKANDSLLARLGYGGDTSGGVNVNVGIAHAPSVSPEQLQEARNKLRANEQIRDFESPRSAPMIDVSPTPSGASAPLPPWEEPAAQPRAVVSSETQAPTKPDDVL